MTSTRKFILTVTTWLLVVHNSSCTSVKLHCFCTDSTKCPKAVCTSQYGCYIDVIKHILNTTHVQQKIIYGCTEEHNIKSCKKHEEPSSRQQTKNNLHFCCSDDDMCNMPLLLKDVIARRRNQERTHRKRKLRKSTNKQACPEAEPAIQLASVILPSILIAVVFFVSFLLFTELIRHRKLYICSKTLKEQIFWKNDSKYTCDNQRKTSLKSLDLTSDTSSLTLSSML